MNKKSLFSIYEIIFSVLFISIFFFLFFPIQNNIQETDYLYYDSFLDSFLEDKKFQKKILSPNFHLEDYSNQILIFDENIQDYFLSVSSNTRNITLNNCSYLDDSYNEKYITSRIITINRSFDFDRSNTISQNYNFRKIFFGVCLK